MRTSIGEDYYLYRANPNGYANELVISAHGAIFRFSSSRFATEWGTLLFYSRHGEATDDLGIGRFTHGGPRRQVVERLSPPTECFDYMLSKYQGRHNRAGETADTIAERQHYVDDFNERLGGALVATGQAAPNTLPLADLLGSPGFQARSQLTAGGGMATPFDVLAVRNRNDVAGVRRITGLTHHVRLSEALAAVGAVHRYPIVHCYFCRSFAPF